MSGFSNPIIGGGGALVYPAIKSPNFSASPLRGWSIDKDGNAYFGDLTASGSITGTSFIIDSASGGVFAYSGTVPVTFGSSVNPDSDLTNSSWGALRTTFDGFNVLDLGAGGSYQSGSTENPPGAWPPVGLTGNDGYRLTITAWLPASYSASDIQIEWTDDTGNSVGTDPTGSFPPVTEAGWYTFQVGGTAPPTCTGAYLIFEIVCGASDHIYVRQFDLQQGSAALIASFASQAGTDPYGYQYPAGIAFNSGFTYGSLLSYRTVGSSQLAIGSVINEKIASQAVATANIQDAAITNALLATAAVAAGNIQNGAVTTQQINAAAGILGSQLDANAGITGGQLSDLTITVNKFKSDDHYLY